MTSTQNVFYNSFGAAGVERGILITAGNLASSPDRIDYEMVYLTDPMDCTGDVYTLRFLGHSDPEHFEVELRDASNALVGSMTADRGSLPVIVDQDSIALQPGVLGPTVITDGMRAQVDDVRLFQFLDANTMGELPLPSLFNGSPMSGGQFFAGLAAYGAVIGQQAQVLDLIRFRRPLVEMNSNAITRAKAAISAGQATAAVKDQSAPNFGQDHTMVTIEHGNPNASETAARWGGFFNGHRRFLEAMEDMLLGEVHARRTPFRRLPAWNSDDSVPGAFMPGTLLPCDPGVHGTSMCPEVAQAPNIAMPADIAAANVCDVYDPANSSAQFLEDQLIEMELQMYLDYMAGFPSWHANTHVDSGGMLGGTFPEASQASLFFPWHTSVDLPWRNWQLCWAAWNTNVYSTF